jgi:hypothetical protein
MERIIILSVLSFVPQALKKLCFFLYNLRENGYQKPVFIGRGSQYLASRSMMIYIGITIWLMEKRCVVSEAGMPGSRT